MFHADMRGNVHERSAIRRYWTRAAIVTLHDRALTTIPIPRRSTKDDYVERFEPFWAAVPDDQLHELLTYLRPFFRRKENRATPL